MARSAVLATLLIAATFVAASAGDARTTRDAGRLIVVSPKYELVVVRPDGTGSRRLTRPLPGIHAPLWSADGTRVAFLRGKPGRLSLDEPVYVVRADGSGLHAVARGNSAQWSPDGRSLVLVDVHGLNVVGTDRRPPVAGRIVVLDIRSGRRHVIGRGNAPGWSPDGKRIAFVRYKYSRDQGWTEESASLLTVRADGSDVRVLRRAVAGQVLYRPKWSPDGRTIAVYAVDLRPDLWLINARTGATTLLASQVTGSFIEWSPNGRRLTFQQRPNYALATVDVKSGHVHVVAVETGDWILSAARWSPDGTRIAFEQWNEFLERGGVYTVDSTQSRRRPKRIAWVNWLVEDGFDWGRS